MPLIKRTDAPTFDAGGTSVIAYASPSRGAAEVSVWQIELAPGSTSPRHHMDREEVFLGVSGFAVAEVGGVEYQRGAGDGLTLPAVTEFTLHSPGQEPYRALACVRAGAQATITAD